MDDKAEDFLALFNEVFPLINTFPGCTRLELLRDIDNPSIFFTYSHWDKPESLEAYRTSALFKSTWERTKILFAHKAAAWSVERDMRF